MVNVLQFVVVLGVLVMIHELGHFITAKRAGVRVLEFGFGFPPRVFGIRRGETIYSLNAVPIGGFVKMLGEEDPTEPRSLARQSALTRLLVLSAGPLMNILLAAVLFSASYMIPRETVTGPVIVQAVAPESPAERAGLKAGDQIVRINGRPVESTLDVGYNVRLALGGEIEMVVKRDRFSTVMVNMVPRWNPPAGQGPTGIQIGMSVRYPSEQSMPVWEAVPFGLQRAADSFLLLRNEVATWIINRVTPQMSGPIGIYQMTNEASQAGPGYLLEFVALLSLQLGIFNLLPFPMLDGGRIVFVLLEVLRRGKRIPAEKEALVHLVGLVVLLTMIVVVSYNDILRIVNNESVFR